MKKMICILNIIIYATICSAQIDNNTLGMRKFDSETYEKNKIGNNTYYRYKTIEGDSIEITLEDFGTKYLKYITYINTPHQKYYEYNKRTLRVTFENETFYNCVIGFRREYNESGELTKEINNDTPFKFTWQELIEKMRDEYGIELWNIEEQRLKGQMGASVGRDTQRLIYGISLKGAFVEHEGLRGRSVEYFEIDGTTGELLKHWGNDDRKHPSIKNEK